MHQNHPGISRIISLSRIHIWFPNIDHEITLQELEYAIKTLGIKHIPTAAYHQTSNGQAERYVQTVKNKTLKERLFDFLTSYRSTSHTVQIEHQQKSLLVGALELELTWLSHIRH